MPGNLESPEARQAALREVRRMLSRQAVLAQLAHPQDSQQREVIERLARKQEVTALTMLLARLHAADVADILEGLPLDERKRVWDAVRGERGGEVLLEAKESVRGWLIGSLAEDELPALLEQLDADDLAWLAEDLPSAALAARLAQLSSHEQQWVASALGYGEDSVGALMTREYTAAQAGSTVADIVARLREEGRLPEQTDAVYVVDGRGVLQGRIPLEQLLLVAPLTPLGDLVIPDVAAFSADDDAQSAVNAFERYDLVSAPVLNHRRQLVGRLTVEAVMGWMHENSHEGLLASAGLAGEEDLYAPVAKSARNRAYWLLVNLCTAFIASRVIGLFETTIEQLVALATLMPIVASIGGNTGNQTTALIIRALALDQVRNDNLRYVYRKEITVALLNGAALALIVGLFALVLYHDWHLALTIGLAMIICLSLAAVVGVSVPLLLKRFDRDPALGSSTLVTAFTDSFGFFVFLGLATLLLA